MFLIEGPVVTFHEHHKSGLFLAMVATPIDSAHSIYNYNVFRPFAFCTIAQLTGEDYRKLCSNNAHVIL